MSASVLSRDPNNSMIVSLVDRLRRRGGAMLSAIAQVAEAQPPLSERILLAVIGPLVGAIVGTGIIGGLLWWLSNRVERARAEEEKQRAHHELENELRHELLT